MHQRIEFGCVFINTNIERFRMEASVWKKRQKYMCEMAQRQLSDYYYNLDAKIKARYLQKIYLIKQEDPRVR